MFMEVIRQVAVACHCGGGQLRRGRLNDAEKVCVSSVRHILKEDAATH